MTIKQFIQISSYFIFLTSININCSKSTPPKIFYTVVREDFVITVTASGELEAKNSKSISTPSIYPQPTISYLAPEGSIVKKGEVAVRFESEQISKDLLTALDQLEMAKADAQKKEAELNLQRMSYESQLKTAQASLVSNNLQLAKLVFEAPRVQEIKKLQIQQQQLEANKAQKKLKSLEKIQTEDRKHYELKIKQAENKIDRANSQLESLELKSPTDGIVVYGINPMTGQKVKEGESLFFGMPVAQIPDLSVMQAKFLVGETEAQKIKSGQQAKIIVPVIGDNILNGKVTRVGRIAKPIKRGSRVKKVDVFVEIDSTNKNLVPGLTVKGNIIIEKFSDAIAVPLECIFDKNNVKVIFEYKKRSFIPHPVAIYNQDENFAVLMSDLTGGELLVFKKPNEVLISWPDSLIAPILPEKPDAIKKPDPPDKISPEERKKQILEMLKNRKPGR